MIDPDKQQAARIVAVIKTLIIAVPIAAMVLLALASSLFDNPSDPTDPYAGTSPAQPPQNRPSDSKIIPATLKTYRQIRNLPTGLNRPMDIAWANEKLYIVGDNRVTVMDPVTGETLDCTKVASPPTCVWVNDSFISVASQSAIFVLQQGETEFRKITELKPAQANLVDIAANLDTIFAADSYSGTVYKISITGEVMEKIRPGGEDGRFLVPKMGDFDVIFAVRGMLWISDPGRGEVMSFNTSGVNDEALNWGKHGNRLVDFSGTYNPVHIAMLPNTNIVTAELDPVCVKVYSDTGALLAVVVTEKDISKRARRLNLATDSTSHIYVLDDVSKTVRVYEKLDTSMPMRE